MAELKTRPNPTPPLEYINGIANAKRKADAMTLYELLSDLMKEEGTMWGGSIVGFGSYTQTYANGKTADWMQIGFSGRAQSLVLYLMDGTNKYQDLLDQMGPYTTGKSCLYIKDLSKINLTILREVCRKSIEHMASL
ncbi:MAG: hypothetical protein SchgKO_21050 [Schleiferiaceae bacterium]